MVLKLPRLTLSYSKQILLGPKLDNEKGACVACSRRTGVAGQRTLNARATNALCCASITLLSTVPQCSIRSLAKVAVCAEMTLMRSPFLLTTSLFAAVEE